LKSTRYNPEIEIIVPNCPDKGKKDDIIPRFNIENNADDEVTRAPEFEIRSTLNDPGLQSPSRTETETSDSETIDAGQEPKNTDVMFELEPRSETPEIEIRVPSRPDKGEIDNTTPRERYDQLEVANTRDPLSLISWTSHADCATESAAETMTMESF